MKLFFLTSVAIVAFGLFGCQDDAKKTEENRGKAIHGQELIPMPSGPWVVEYKPIGVVKSEKDEQGQKAEKK